VSVVSLAPEQPAAATADAAPAAGLEDSVKASVEEPWAAIAAPPAVELAGVAGRIARLAEAESFLEGVVRLGVPEASPLSISSMSSFAYLPAVNGVIATATNVQGARASPRERDGHRAVAAKAEEQEPPSAGVVPGGPLDRQGLGSSGGSAGGVAGAGSLRYFAIASTPLRFDFPSTFSHEPLPSSVPEGALEACPTTRPG
jgi:hypothetical protein